MSDEPKYLDVAEFRRLGFLQEANRQFFHPHGLALSIRQIESNWEEEEVAKSPWMSRRIEQVLERLPDDVRERSSARHTATEICRALWPRGSEHLADVWDYREDSEGILYGNLATKDRERANAVDEERVRHRAPRARLFGRDDEARPDLLDPDPIDVEPLDYVYRES